MKDNERGQNVLGRVMFWMLIAAGLISGIIAYNEAPFLYWESNQYRESDPKKLMDERAAPIYSIQGNKKAILFIHGFAGTPATFRDYAELAVKSKYDVMVPLLPGMGTTPPDMYGQTFSGWCRYIQEIYLKYRKNYKEFYIVGMSMGGSLALKLAENFEAAKTPALAPTAIAVISAPVFINSLFESGVVMHPAAYVCRIVSLFTNEIDGDYSIYGEGGADVARWVGYNGVFPAQIQSIKIGLKRIKDDLWKISIPVYMAQAVGDKVVNYKNLGYIGSHISSKIKQVHTFDLGNTEHKQHLLVLLDDTGEVIYSEIMEFFKKIPK
ncbi:MAG: alpha/beta fold hydrolase [Brevinematales bacterium]|nr:alpha/beta fold hydrolase [Brevinematales bacterium]